MSKAAINVEAIYPLMPMQQGLLFHALYDPKSEAYFVQFGYRVTSSLNVPAFKRAWEKMLERHAVLRTLFIWQRNEKMVQVVRRTVELPWQEHDWRGLAPDEQNSRLQSFLAEDRKRGFDLAQAPLIRIALIRMEADVNEFVLDFHHLIMDGWSLALVLKEVFTLYESYRQRQDRQLPPTRHYRDYIGWLQQQDSSGAEQFWRRNLEGITAPTPLVIDLPGADSTEGVYGEQRMSFSAATSKALQQFARQHQLTLNTLMQGAWALLLSRYSGQTDVIFGAVVSGRPPELSGVEDMVGLFINTLPVRARVDANATLVDWLQQLQAEQVEMRNYEYASLADVQRWSDVPAGTPLFDSFFLFQNYAAEDSLPEERLGALQFELNHSVTRATYALQVVALSRPELGLHVGYDSNRFEDKTIERMLGHLKTILEAMSIDPHQRLSAIPLLTNEEQQQLLVDWNETSTSYPSQQCIHNLFEAQVEQNPDRTAIAYDGASISYRELDRRANQLAHRLQSLGVRPEVRVGLLMERSIEMVVGLLGVLKAGGAYVPLEPSNPIARTIFMLRNSQALILLTQTHLVNNQLASETRVVCLSSDGHELSTESDQPPKSNVRSENLAYLIYTSGSTGQPKGVMVTHQGVVNYLSWCTKEYRLDQGHGSVVHSPLAFDLTVTSVLAPLIVGQRLELLPEEQGVDGLSTALRDGLDYSLVKITPSHLEAIGSLLAGEAMPRSTRALIIGGELLRARSISSWRRAAPGVRIINEYGPTETVVGCCVYEVKADDPQDGLVPIGRPIANTELYLLDAQQQPVPVGVPGELYIGGAGLARGYFGLPELTAERFVPNPFADEAGSRLYRTGDLAVYQPDGNLVYLRRLDDQVKVRGFRIELGEIEIALSEHPSIKDAVVVPVEHKPGQTYLAAYVVPGKIGPTDTTSLREYLGQKLPEYMIPGVYVWLAELPLTVNGKVDRAALPAPERGSDERERKYVAARTEAEQRLVEIWEQVLGVERVGIYDNFFELGGDSILSIQIVARANRAGLHLMPKDLFQHQEIARLAQVLREESSVTAEQGAVSGAVRLTPIQQWFFESEVEESGHYNQAVLLQVQAGIEVEKLAAAWQALVQQHDALRLRFKRGPEGWSSWNEADEETRLEQVDLESEAERSVALAARVAAVQGSLNLSEGPIARAVYFDYGERVAGRLLVVVHHLAVDGISWRILLEDLQRGYEQLSNGAEVELGAKSTSFQSWAEQLYEQAQRAEWQAQEQYWTEQGWGRARALPVDKESGPQRVATAATVSQRLSEEETRRLLQEVPETYHTQINEVLLTALGRALGEWLGEGEVIVEVEGHGREEVIAGVDLSRTVGWFTTLYPVLLETGVSEELGAGLKRVKEQLRQLPQQGIGFGMLKYLSADDGVRERLRRIPRGAVSFNYLGQFDQVLKGSALLSAAAEGSGPTQSGDERLRYQLSVNSLVREGRLQVSWTYSQQTYEAATIEQLAESYLKSLREIIAHCGMAESGFTASDFPLAKLNQEKLAQIGSLLNRRAAKGSGRT